MTRFKLPPPKRVSSVAVTETKPVKFKLPTKTPTSIRRGGYADAARQEALRVQPDPDATKAEVILYEANTSGRSSLEAACRAAGLSWGIVKITQTFNNGQQRTSSVVLVGKLYETIDAAGDLDTALSELATAIEEEYAEEET